VTLWTDNQGDSFSDERESADDVAWSALPSAEMTALLASHAGLARLLQEARSFVLLDSADDTEFGAMRRAMLARIDAAIGGAS
jgi:hypothetical protein